MNELTVLNGSQLPASISPIRQWLAGQRSPLTRKAYETDMRLFLAFTRLTEDDLNRLHRSDIVSIVEGYRDSISQYKEGSNYILNAKTVSRKLMTLRVFFQYLVESGRIERNPVEYVKSVTVPDKSTREGMTEFEFCKILEAVQDGSIRGKRNRVILNMLYHCCLRRSEVANIRIEDLIQNGENGQVRVIGKGNQFLIKDVPAQLLQQIETYLQATGRDLNAKGFLFLSHSNRNSNSEGITDQSIYAMFKDAVKKAGIAGNKTPHSLRHASITHALNRKSDIMKVKAMSGHKDIKMITHYYRGGQESATFDLAPNF